MSKYPVEIGDDEGIADALNYLLSGPGGLGQNFAGLTSSVPNYVTGNFRIPYTQTTPAKLYIPSISLSSAEMLDDRTFKYTFTSPQVAPPFSLGNGVTIENFTNPIYNTSGLGTGKYQIGVVECTTTYFIVRSIYISNTIYPIEYSGSAICYYYSTGEDFINNGTIDNSVQDLRVTVTGGTDRVFVSSQCDFKLTLQATTTGIAYVQPNIQRWKGFVNDDPTNPDYLFDFDSTVIIKTIQFPFVAGTNVFEFTNIFTNVVDYPTIGYYRYFYNIGLGTDALVFTDAQFTECEVNVRSMSTQVVKQ